MSLTYGFYNSINGDRKYDAVQLSSIFDGLIVDGVFASIGTAFSVKATAGLTVSVGEGKAWFNHTWTVNDSELLLDAPESEILLDRIDAVVLEINSSEAVRANTIKFVTGEPATYPQRPSMVNDTFVHQYPLCFIERKAASTEIRQGDITPMIGSEETPFVAAILKTLSLEELLGKWQDDLDQFVADREHEFDVWFDTKKEELTAEHQALQQWIQNEENGYATWLAEMKEQITADLEAEREAFDQWEANEQADFTEWFNNIKGQLSEDPAGHLQLEYEDLLAKHNDLDERHTTLRSEFDKEEIDRLLLVGFVDGTKEFSDDGLTISSTDSLGRKLVKTFSSDFLTMKVVLSDTTSSEIATMTKTFAADGRLIDTDVTYN